MPYTVCAGKYKPDGERNYKYIDKAHSKEVALKLVLQVRDYPWSFIEGPCDNCDEKHELEEEFLCNTCADTARERSIDED